MVVVGSVVVVVGGSVVGVVGAAVGAGGSDELDGAVVDVVETVVVVVLAVVADVGDVLDAVGRLVVRRGRSVVVVVSETGAESSSSVEREIVDRRSLVLVAVVEVEASPESAGLSRSGSVLGEVDDVADSSVTCDW